MIPKLFIEECEANGVERYFDAWFALGEQALDRLVTVARTNEDGGVGLADSRVIAEEMFGRYGEEVVTSMTMQNLTFGIGKQLWDMKFFNEDGTPIPDEEAWGEVRKYLKGNPPDPWEWGKHTLIRWVLRNKDGA